LVLGDKPMRRRDVIALLGSGVAGWPFAARARQAALPVVGFLGAPSAGPYTRYVAAVHQGLREVGYIEHQNVAMEYRWADGQYDRLPASLPRISGDCELRVMQACSIIGLLFAAALFTTIPILPQVTLRGEVSVARVQALADGPHRRVQRRAYRHSYRYARRVYRRAYHYDCVGYFGPGCCGAPAPCRRGWR
jgi:hypothetical protein